MGNVANVKIEAMNVIWGKDTPEVQTILCAGDVASSLNDKYFYIQSALDAIKYYVWFNVGGTGMDPVPGGATAVPVTLSIGATPNVVATAVASALAVIAASFTSATAVNNIVTVTNSAPGYCSPARDSKSASKCGFGFQVLTQGMQAVDVGLIEGDVELKLGEVLDDIKSHQTGDIVLGQLRKGLNVELKVNFKETSRAQIEKVLSQSGTTFLPEGAGTTKVVGIGTSKQFSNTFAQASQLYLHPVAKPASDKTEDWTIWLAYPKAPDLKFSGEKFFDMPLDFKIFVDATKPPEINLMVFGDATQALV